MKTICEIPQFNAANKDIRKLLKESKRLAIVGLSNNKEKISNQVAQYLIDVGYNIIPVNPNYEQILGHKCYKSLAEILEPVDIIVIFRKPQFILPLAKEVLKFKIRPKGFWMQLGLAHNEAATVLQNEGIIVVQSQCIKIVHNQLRHEN